MLTSANNLLVHVFQEFGKVEELGNQLFHIVRIVHEQLECLRNRMELTIGHIEAATLQFDVQRCERFDAQQVMQHTRRIRIVCAIMEFRYNSRGILETIEFGAHLIFVARIHDADRFAEIAERFRIVQIEHGASVIGQYPREHRVLTEVIVRTPSNRIQLHQVFEIGNLSIDPALRQSGRFQQFGRRTARTVQNVRRLQAQYLREHFVARFRCEIQKIAGLVDQKYFQRTASQIVLAQVHLLDLAQRKFEIVVFAIFARLIQIDEREHARGHFQAPSHASHQRHQFAILIYDNLLDRHFQSAGE